jgi:hypothetical protein
MALTLSTEVAEVTSKARVLPARDFTKTCMSIVKEEEQNYGDLKLVDIFHKKFAITFCDWPWFLVAWKLTFVKAH